MTSRERWTIYPLLFLALGAALRNKGASTFEVSQITTERLEIVDHDGKPRLKLGVSRHSSGILEISDKHGHVVAVLAADSKAGCGELALLGAEGKEQVQIGSDGAAGIIRTATARGATQVLIHSESEAGAVVTLDRNRAAIVELSSRAGATGVAVEQARGPEEKKPASSAP